MWNGMFSPSLTKRIGVIRLTPLDHMTNEDWDWLDWYNLRNAAKNRMALKILLGLVAFIEVFLEQPEDEPEEESEEESGRWVVARIGGRAKRRYIYGATGEDEEEFDDTDHDFFRNEPDDKELNEAAKAIDNFLDRLEDYERLAIKFEAMRLARDERVDRALSASDNLSDENFYLLVAIVVAFETRNSRKSMSEAFDAFIDNLGNANRIAAGRGI